MPATETGIPPIREGSSIMGTKGGFISLAQAAAEADKQSVSIGVKVTGPFKADMYRY